jgi:hypothetical protein
MLEVQTSLTASTPATQTMCHHSDRASEVDAIKLGSGRLVVSTEWLKERHSSLRQGPLPLLPYAVVRGSPTSFCAILLYVAEHIVFGRGGHLLLLHAYVESRHVFFFLRGSRAGELCCQSRPGRQLECCSLMACCSQRACSPLTPGKSVTIR